MKSQAPTSILVLEYDNVFNKFRVINRTEIESSEFTFDKAVKRIIDINAIYNPSYIYLDRGAGEYQLETLKIYGQQHPKSGLDKKIVGFMFSEKIDVQDPITGVLEKKHLKPFMVNQLSILIERGNLILSPWDNHIYKQLVDYRVEKISAAGVPQYNSDNEHFVDSLGLAYLAFVQHFPELTKLVKKKSYDTVYRVHKGNMLPTFEKRDLENPWTEQKKKYESSDEAWEQVPLHDSFGSRSTPRKQGYARNKFTRTLF